MFLLPCSSWQRLATLLVAVFIISRIWLQQLNVSLRQTLSQSPEISSNVIDRPSVEPVLTDLVYFNRYLCINTVHGPIFQDPKDGIGELRLHYS